MGEPQTQQGIGAAIRALRVTAGMTHEEVSEAAGVSPSYLSRAENGQVSPTAGWIQLVAISIGTYLAEKSAA